MKKFYVFFLVSFLFTLNLYAETQEGYPLKAVDDLGNELVLEKQPSRILSGTLMTDEILLNLVDQGQIIGVTTFSEDPAVSNVAALVDSIPNKVTLNVELFISLDPDLIFLADWSVAENVKQLRDAGLTVYLVKTPLTFNGVKEIVLRIGELVGEKQKAQQLADWMKSKLQHVSQRVDHLSAEQKKTVMDYGVWGDAMGKGSTWDEIIKHAGLINAVGDITPTQWGTVPISKEKLIEIDPDILILPGWVYDDPTGPDEFFDQIVLDPALSDLKSIKNETVYILPENHKGTTSHYIVLAVEDLARFAYPELFE